ncbi:cyclic nucleotide-binding domain-containing protein [Haloechinothrix sp. LS1_15]|uniref:cyclic nucleotide-binding domain-containing protein n=1 Tax=Haloechinothrix sp. LS1_15 TaxID=2652248 RepID=UPI002948AF42|nr:cyclic nucleotide-binding domain-containing protein [Haloechinothrix sp. LS1_15]MDV6013640.1 cyclic nucleotide-binding domain-containing protein [Haloechinothrix sp. LS1_15]
MATRVPKEGSEARYLHRFPAFEELTQSEVNAIVRASTRASLPANWALIHEQTPGDACYILLSGIVGIYSGQDLVAELGPGDVVGEMALRHGRLRSATVSTREPVELLRIDGGDLDRLLERVPAFRRVLDTTGRDGDTAGA